MNHIKNTIVVGFELDDARELILKYEDEDGDRCTLVEATLSDYLSAAKGNVLPKIWLHETDNASVAEQAATDHAGGSLELCDATLPEPSSLPLLPSFETTQADKDSETTSEGRVLAISLETPPSSPRDISPGTDRSSDMSRELRRSSIEDEYEEGKDGISWTFVAHAIGEQQNVESEVDEEVLADRREA